MDPLDDVSSFFFSSKLWAEADAEWVAQKCEKINLVFAYIYSY